MTKQEEIRDKRIRIREGIEAVIDPNYMRDNCLVPNEVVFFIFDILNSEGVVIRVEEEPDDDQYYGDEPYHMYEDGWRRFEPLIEEK